MPIDTKDIQWDVVLPQIKAKNADAALQICAQEAAPLLRFPSVLLKKRLLSPEHMQEAPLGEGVALAHLRLPGVARPFTLLASLQQSVDFKAPDGQMVDLVAFLISPERDGNLHLTRLARLSRVLKNRDLRQKIAEARDADMIRALLHAPEGWMAAA